MRKTGKMGIDIENVECCQKKKKKSIRKGRYLNDYIWLKKRDLSYPINIEQGLASKNWPLLP